jgi:hypothetical protein
MARVGRREKFIFLRLEALDASLDGRGTHSTPPLPSPNLALNSSKVVCSSSSMISYPFRVSASWRGAGGAYAVMEHLAGGAPDAPEADLGLASGIAVLHGGF